MENRVLKLLEFDGVITWSSWFEPNVEEMLNPKNQMLRNKYGNQTGVAELMFDQSNCDRLRDCHSPRYGE